MFAYLWPLWGGRDRRMGFMHNASLFEKEIKKNFKGTFNISILGFSGGSEVKASACNAGDRGSIPRSGRSPGEGNGNPLQYSFLENPMEGGT